MKPDQILNIDGRLIGPGKPSYFIADIAANHDGSLERAKKLIYLAAESGADAAKFQHFQAETIVSDYGFRSLGEQKSHQALWGMSVFDVYKAASVSLEWTADLKKTCDDAGITFFTSPYSIDLVDLVDPWVPAYKIGSGDLTWTEIIEHVAGKNKPYILATGASTLDDVVRAVEAALPINQKLALLQCNTNYTGEVENLRYVQLRVLRTYAEMFPGMVLGLSDHTPGHATVLGAIALGAKIIEKHFTDDVRREGPDHAFSMDPTAWRDMVARTRELESALGTGLKRIEDNETETVILQRRAVRVRADMAAGQRIERADVELLRPCPIDALPPYTMNQIIGKTLRYAMTRGAYLKITDIE